MSDALDDALRRVIRDVAKGLDILSADPRREEEAIEIIEDALAQARERLEGRPLMAGKTLGQLAYEAEVAAKPVCHDGTPRRAWANLPEYARASWERKPEPRYGVRPQWPVETAARICPVFRSITGHG